MEKKNFKKCVILYNPVSTGFEENSLNLMGKTLKNYGYNPEFAKSMYQKHMVELIKEADDRNTLILTLGGDGTVKEAFEAYNQIRQKGLYAHVPTGTTNDMAKNFNVTKKDPNNIMEEILNGDVTTHDSFLVNDDVAAYVSIFGFLAHVPYKTDPKLKKYLGHAGYVTTALKDLIKKPIPYELSYEVDGKKINTECILGAISNSKGFAGIDLFKDANLNDGKLEYLFAKNISPKIIAKLFKEYLKNEIDLSKYPDIITTGSASEIKLRFTDNCPEYEFDIDGEKSNVLARRNEDIIIRPGKQIKIMKAKKH